MTAVTGFGTVYLNLVRQALARFHKADIKAYCNIRSLSWRIGVGALSATAAEYRIENVTEVYTVRRRESTGESAESAAESACTAAV